MHAPRALTPVLVLAALLAPALAPGAAMADAPPACAGADACGDAAIHCVLATPASLHPCRDDAPLAPGHETFRVATDGGAEALRLVVTWTATHADAEVLGLRVVDARDQAHYVIGRSPLVVELGAQPAGDLHGALLPCLPLTQRACEAGDAPVRVVRDQPYAYALQRGDA